MVAQTSRLLPIAAVCVVVFATCVFAAPIEPAPADPPPTSADGPPDDQAEDAPSEETLQGNVWARDPRFQTPKVEAARKALRAGNKQECIRQLQLAADDDGSFPPPSLAIVHLLLGMEQWQAAIFALDEAAVQARFDPEVYLTCAQLAMLNGRRTDAAVHYEQALRLEKPEAWSDEHKLLFAITCLSGLADISQWRKDWAGANEIYAKWAALEPTNAQLFDEWGKALFLSGNQEAALARFSEAHKLDKNISPGELSLAAMQAKVGKFTQAEVLYRKAIKLYPQDARPVFEFGCALLMQGKTAEAAAQFKQASEIGTSLESLGTDVPLMHGLLSRAQGDYTTAEKHFKDVLKKSPGHTAALAQLPLVLIEQQEPAKRKQALQIAQQAAKNQPNTAAILAALGWVQFQSGQTDAAAATMRRVIASRDPEIIFLAAQVLSEHGEPGEAKPLITALQQSVAQPGMFLLRAEAQAWLETATLVN